MAKKANAPKQQVRQVQLTDSAMDALNTAVKLNGMFQKELLSRIIERFALLDRPSQQLLIGTLASEYADDAGDRLKHRLIELIHEDEQANLDAQAARPTTSPADTRPTTSPADTRPRTSPADTRPKMAAKKMPTSPGTPMPKPGDKWLRSTDDGKK